MTNIIYEYPLTSCNNCINENFPVTHMGHPTNMSVIDCKFPETDDPKVFSESIQPQPNRGFKNLNPQVLTEKFDKNFRPVSEDQLVESCGQPQFYSSDPRLISVPHMGQRLLLDRPPIQSSMRLDDIATSERLDGYGQNYKSYSDVNAGQIMYTIDKSIQNPYFSPNFTNSSVVTGYVYQDPMGALKPRYPKVPLRHDNPIGQTPRNNYVGCLSAMQDTLDQRENIMAAQMSVRNQQRFEPRYAPWK